MNMHLGPGCIELIDAAYLYKMFNEAIAYNMIQNVKDVTPNDRIYERHYKIGNILFKFNVSRPGGATHLGIYILNGAIHLELFSSSNGWKYKNDEITHGVKIKTFLRTIYNKVNKKRELKQQDVKVENARKRKEKIELLNTIKVKELC